MLIIERFFWKLILTLVTKTHKWYSKNTSLRKWRYCVGAIKVLAAEPWSKKGSGEEAFIILKHYFSRRIVEAHAAKFHSTSTQYRQLATQATKTQSYKRLYKDSIWHLFLSLTLTQSSLSLKNSYNFPGKCRKNVRMMLYGFALLKCPPKMLE